MNVVQYPTKPISSEPTTLYEAKQKLAELQQKIYGTTTWRGMLSDAAQAPAARASGVSLTPAPGLLEPEALDADQSPARLKFLLSNLSNSALKTLLGVETGRTRHMQRPSLIGAIYREMKSRKL
jgi:hypothetical protein